MIKEITSRTRKILHYQTTMALTGLLLGIAFYSAAIWFVQNIIGWKEFWSLFVAMPFTGILLSLWWGCLAAWDYFRQAVSNLEDDRN